MTITRHGIRNWTGYNLRLITLGMKCVRKFRFICSLVLLLTRHSPIPGTSVTCFPRPMPDLTSLNFGSAPISSSSERMPGMHGGITLNANSIIIKRLIWSCLVTTLLERRLTILPLGWFLAFMGHFQVDEVHGMVNITLGHIALGYLKRAHVSRLKPFHSDERSAVK